MSEKRAFGTDRRWLLVAGLAVFALGLYLSIEAGRLLRAGREAEGRLLRPGEGSLPKELSYDQFMTMFGAMSRDPGGVSFAETFMAKPPLKAHWREFERKKDVKALVQALRDEPAFKEVLVEESVKPGFRPLVQRTLALLPGLSSLLKPEVLADFIPGESSRPSRDRLVLVRAGSFGAPAASPRAGLARKDRGRSAFARPAAGRPGASFDGSGSGSFSGYQPQAGLRSNDTRGTGPGGGPGSGPGAPGRFPGGSERVVRTFRSADAQAATPLAEVGTVPTERRRELIELYPWLGSMSAFERDRLLGLVDRFGLWGACFALDMYDRCRTACGAAGGCLASDGWRSCLDFQDGSDEVCATLCPLQAGCSVPSGVASNSGGGGGDGDGGDDDGGDDGRPNPTTPTTPPTTPPKATPTTPTTPKTDPPQPDPDPEPEVQPDPPPRRRPRERPECLAAGTLVRTPGGERAIEELSPGEAVLSVDERTGRSVPARVVRLRPRGPRPTLRLSLEDGRELLATSEHPLYDPERKEYRLSGGLAPGAALAEPGPGGLRILRVSAVSAGPIVTVFDLSVEGPFHNFIAGGILVHNKPPRVQIE